jgi:Beta-propeller repeat
MRLFARFISLSFVLGLASVARSESIEWIRQFGTNDSDRSFAISADPLGNVFVSAETLGSLAGANAGSVDIVLRKYDTAGNLAWSRQFGTPQLDQNRGGLSADGFGNVYISGDTNGSLAGSNAGQRDVFVRKYDAAGNVLWSQQFGTNMGDFSGGASADGLGNVYVCGGTFGNIAGSNGSGRQFVRKYTAGGTALWTTQFGDVNEGGAVQISADGLGNVFGVGRSFGTPTNPNSGFSDAIVFKLDSTGALVWKQAFGGTTDTFGNDAIADGLGNVYITGSTHIDFAAFLAGNSDAFVSKYDSAGNKLWTKLLGGSTREAGTGIAVDGQGNVYLSGNVNVPIGMTGDFQPDVFVSKLDATGNLIWTRQFGTVTQETADGGFSLDGLGGVYTSGLTFGSLGGPNAGGGDSFVVKIFDTAVPELATGALAVLCIFCLPLVAERRRNVRAIL